MLGKSFEEEYPLPETDLGQTLLSVKGLARGSRVRGVDLEARSGEIVAVVGLVGAGKTELSRLLFGVDMAESGTIAVKGRQVKLREPADAVAAGIVLVPEERRKEGILVGSSVLHNLSLPILQSLTRLGIVSAAGERRNANAIINRLGIKTASAGQLLGYLSGGNQQKVAIGKWLHTEADIFLLNEPTKGVDIGAKRDIFQIIGDLARRGKAIIYMTCEFTEALGLADRIMVMCDGQMVKQFERGEATQEQLMYYASSVREELT